MEKFVNAMEEKLNKKNIMKVWKDYTIEDAVFIGKAETIKHHIVNSC